MTGFTLSPPLFHSFAMSTPLFWRRESSLGAPMLFTVLSPIHYLKVLWAVIQTIAIDMVYMLMACKTATKQALRNQAVQANIAIVAHVNESIAIPFILSRPSLQTITVMARNIAPSLTMMYRCGLSTATGTKPKLNLSTPAMTSNVYRWKISPIRAVWQSHTTTALAQGRGHMATAIERGFRFSQRTGKDKFLTTTFAVDHEVSINQMANLVKIREVYHR